MQYKVKWQKVDFGAFKERVVRFRMLQKSEEQKSKKKKKSGKKVLEVLILALI